MKCFHCHQEIGKQEQAKMVCEYRKDGVITSYGLLQPAGPLSTPDKGVLLRAYMWKCWQVVIKRNARGGDPMAGRGVLNAPSAYDIEAMIKGEDGKSTAFLTEQNEQRLAIAKEIGVASDSWLMRELMRALDKGVARRVAPGLYRSTGYPHTHQRPVEKAGLAAHLRYAHGMLDPLEPLMETELRGIHEGDHARMNADLIEASRRDDPGSTVDEGPELEWPAGGTSTVEL